MSNPNNPSNRSDLLELAKVLVLAQSFEVRHRFRVVETVLVVDFTVASQLAKLSRNDTRRRQLSCPVERGRKYVKKTGHLYSALCMRYSSLTPMSHVQLFRATLSRNSCSATKLHV